MSRGIWEGFLGRRNNGEALEGTTGNGWAGPWSWQGQIGWRFACCAEELGPSPGGTGEPERALKQGGSMVGPEILPAAQGGRIAGARMKAGRPVWKLTLLTWLYFSKLAFILSNTCRLLTYNICCVLPSPLGCQLTGAEEFVCFLH